MTTPQAQEHRTRGRLARLARLAPLAGLAVLVAALFVEVLVGSEVVRGRDLLVQFYPRCQVIGEALASFEVPRWNPWSFHGQPWFGPRAGGVLYPGYALFALSPPGRAMALFIALHVLLSAEGARRLLRPEAGERAALAGGVAYGLGGFVTSQYWALPYLVTAALLPWSALGGGAPAGPRAARGAALVAACVGLALLAGEPQGALALALVACAAGAARAPSPAAAARRALGVSLAVALGAAAAGPQVLSILAELPSTDRAQAGWSEARFDASPLALALDLVAPGALGDRAPALNGYWGHALWASHEGEGAGDLPWCGLTVGALGLGACAAALSTRPRTGAWRLGLGLTGGGLLLALGGLDAALGLRFPAKWLAISALGLALLAGLGARRLLDDQGVAAARWTITAALVACVAALAALLAAGPRAQAFFEARSAAPVDGAAARTATALALGRAALAGALALGLLELRARRRLDRRRFGALLVALLALDLLTAARPAVERGPRELLEPPPLARLVREAAGVADRGESLDGPPIVPSRPPAPPPRVDASLGVRAALQGGGRLSLLDYDRLYRAALRPNVGYAHGVRSVLAFESVTPAAQRRLLEAPALTRLPGPIRHALLDASLVLVGEGDLERAGAARRVLEPLTRVPLLPGARPALLVRNLACPPWAYLAPAARPVADLDAAIDAVTDLSRRPREVAVLGPEGASLAAAAPSRPRTPDDGEVRVERFEAEAIDLRVRAPAASWLVVREAWSPDWTASVDGAPVEQARADVLFRAVLVPAGEHAVALRYAPRWWGPGLALMTGGWLAIVALTRLERSGTKPPPPS